MKRSSDFMEVRVIDAMDGICVNENFKVYDYIPPKMVRACKYIIGEIFNSIPLGEHIENLTCCTCCILVVFLTFTCDGIECY